MKKDVFVSAFLSVLVLSVLIAGDAAFIDAGGQIPALPLYGEVTHRMTFSEAFWWNFQYVFVNMVLATLLICAFIVAMYWVVQVTRMVIEEIM